MERITLAVARNTEFLFTAAASFAGGILFQQVVGVDRYFAQALALTAIGLVVVCIFRKTCVYTSLRFTVSFCVAIILFFISLGILRSATAYRETDQLARYLDRRITLEGVVVREPERRANASRYIVEVESVGENPVEIVKDAALVLVSSFPHPVFSYGDRLRIRGILTVPKSFATESGREFDYAAYLDAKEGVGYELSFAAIELRDQVRAGNYVQHFLYALKQSSIDAIERTLPQPQSALLSGMIVGGKRSLPDDVKDVFTKAGLVHIVVLSGYNVTVIADAVRSVLGMLPRVFASGASLLAIALFAIMTGGEATVVRASIMAGIAVVGRATGRKFEAGRALVGAALLMVAHTPSILLHDPSFQLSCIATLGLVYFSPIIERRLPFVPNTFGMRTIVATTLSTHIAVLPLLSYMTGNISLSGIPANLLVLPIIPTLMVSGFVLLGAALVHPVIAIPAAFIAHLFLSYVLTAAEWFAGFPWSVISVVVPLWVVCGIYGVYLVVVIYTERKKPTDNVGLSLLLPASDRTVSESRS